MSRRRKLAPGIGEVRLKDGRRRYRARYRDHDRQCRSRTFIEYDNALAWLRERQVETERIRSGLAPPPKPPVPTLREFAAEVVESRMFRSGARHRADVARMILNHWPELLDRPLDEITRRDIKLGLGRLSNTLKSGTVNRVLAALSRVLREAHEDGVLTRNVCMGLRLPERSTVAKALVLDQVRRLLAAAEPCYRPLFAALFYTAGRKSDLLWLRWGQVRFEQALIVFIDTKNGDDVPVTLHPELAPHLRWIIDELYDGRPPPADHLVFRRVHRNSGRWDPKADPVEQPIVSPYKAYRRALARAELPATLRLHDLRHTMGTLLITEGKADIMTVKRHLGHKTLAATMKYLHHTPGQAERVARVKLAGP